MKHIQSEEKIGFKKICEFFLFPLLKEKKSLLIIIIALFFISLSQSILLILFGPFLKSLLGFGVSSDVIRLGDIFPKNIIQYFPLFFNLSFPKKELFYLVPIGILLAAWIRNISIYFYQLGTARISLYIAKSYRDRLFSSVIKSSYLTISRRSPAEWMSILMNDVVFLQTRFTDILNSFLRDSVVILTAFITLIVIHWQTAAFLTCIIPILAFGMGKVAKKIAYFAEKFQTELAKISKNIFEVRLRFDFMRSQKGNETEIKSFQNVNSSYYNFIKKSLVVRSSFAPIMEFIGFAIFALIIFMVGSRSLKLFFVGENLLIFFGAVGLMFRPLKNLGEQIAKFQETKGSLKKSIQLVINNENTYSLPPQTLVGAHHVHSDVSKIEIRKLTLSYDDRETCLSINGLSITKAKTIAIVGPSGSGKSSLARCLAGLVKPDIWEGDISWTDFQNQVSLVSQNPFLFEETLRNNLTYGLGEVSDNDLWNILDCLNIKSEVEELPGQLEYKINPLQLNLSGGQIQRLVIARALLRHKNFYLFDEVTSALDVSSENVVMNTIFSKCREEHKTFIMVTHKLRWLSKFDEIWFLENGRIINSGNHNQLLKIRRYEEFYGSAQSNL